MGGVGGWGTTGFPRPGADCTAASEEAHGGSHGHLFLPGCNGGNQSSDLPGAHMQQDTSLRGGEGINFWAARRKKVSLFTSESYLKASREFQLFNPRGLNPEKIKNKVAWGNV